MQDTGSGLFVTGEGQWQVNLPDAVQGTTSSVWEALVTGLLAGRCHKIPLEDSLEIGATAAAYAADEVGVEFGSPQDVKGYRVEVEVHAIEEGKQSKGPALDYG